MTITKTTNSALSLYTSIDASYISRLRRGERKLPKNQGFNRKLAEYLSGRINSFMQKKTLSEALQVDLDTADDAEITQLIYQWLMNEDPESSNNPTGYFSDFPEIEFGKKFSDSNRNINSPASIDASTSLYWGAEGRRMAVLHFLSEVLASPKKQTILFFSDEDTDWATRDANFTSQWQEKLFEIIRKGNQIIVIHNTQRPLDELVRITDSWLPILLTGGMSSYYCPHIKDGLFTRTVYIAPETSVLFSSGANISVTRRPTYLLKDKELLLYYEEEFFQFLKMCTHLFWIVRPTSIESLINLIIEYDKKPAHTTVRTAFPSLNTMPRELFEKVFSGHFDTSQLFLDFYNRWKASSRKLTSSHIYNEILQLPSVQEVREGKLRIAFSCLAYSSPLYYTAKECAQHLENIVRILKTNRNYRLYLIDASKMSQSFLYYKEGFGVMIFNAANPPVITLSDEDVPMQIARSIFNSYTNNFTYSEMLRNTTIETLEKLIEALYE